MAQYAYSKRYPGPRWDIVYGAYAGIERFALNELYGMVQRFHPYTVAVYAAGVSVPPDENHLVLIGTPDNHPLIGRLVAERRLVIPERAEGYALACLNSPWTGGQRLLVIAGREPASVLYGVEDLDIRVLMPLVPDKPAPERRRAAFDGMNDFAFSDYPRIENRGIWTWGYVIHDYRRFLDAMARLRMNMLTLWHDCPPLNIREVIDYAHARGIKIVLGFPWGWGMDIDIGFPEGRQRIHDMVLDDYARNYRGLGMDGIYFQTLTEHGCTELKGRPVAEIVCEMVNGIGRALLAEEPDLLIQFGLHATSIQDQYPAFEALDPRIRIVWEDAGVIPFAYRPVTSPEIPPAITIHATPEATLDYARKLAGLHQRGEFGMVPKGWMYLDWANEFEHHGAFLLGERHPESVRERRRQRQPEWDRLNALWLENYSLAARFYREILATAPAAMTVTGLIEDSSMEERMQIGISLFAETIWNPGQGDRELLARAASPHYCPCGTVC